VDAVNRFQVYKTLNVRLIFNHARGPTRPLFRFSLFHNPISQSLMVGVGLLQGLGGDIPVNDSVLVCEKSVVSPPRGGNHAKP